jgi:hypothetical protein
MRGRSAWTIGCALVLVFFLGIGLFSYVFSVPSEMVAGVAVSPIPRFGIQGLNQVPIHELWYFASDEWGDPYVFLRGMVVREGSISFALLTGISLIIDERPSWQTRRMLVLLPAFGLMLGTSCLTFGR